MFTSQLLQDLDLLPPVEGSSLQVFRDYHLDMTELYNVAIAMTMLESLRIGQAEESMILYVDTIQTGPRSWVERLQVAYGSSPTVRRDAIAECIRSGIGILEDASLLKLVSSIQPVYMSSTETIEDHMRTLFLN